MLYNYIYDSKNKNWINIHSKSGILILNNFINNLHGGNPELNEMIDDLNEMIVVPEDVQEQAKLGLTLIENGFKGSTQTGIDRGRQLSKDKKISIDTLYKMRTWFSRHGPDAKNGGTSFPGYCKWINDGSSDGSEKDTNKSIYRGAVSWLLWGGNAAYKWLKTDNIRQLLKKGKKSTSKININCPL